MNHNRFLLPLLVLALTLILFGIFMPRAWYDAVPQNAELPPPPVKGVTLLQTMFVIDGLALVLLVRRRRPFERVPETQRLAMGRDSDAVDPISKRTATISIVAITLLGFGLRILHLNSDLWLDEIAPLLTYGNMSTLQVLASYVGSNNHLLNTLLVNWSVSLFGREEWAIRLPAVLFGTATIPAFYWVARLAVSRTASLASALLLSVAYYHIFFSQNSRGYAAYLFFALVSSGLLFRALQSDRFRTWFLYAIALLLGFAALLNTMFVAGAHMLVCAAVVWVIWHLRGGSPVALIKRLVIVYVVVGILLLHLYALALPHAYVYLKTVYTEPSTGYLLLSFEFVSEVLRGLKIALTSAGWIALPVLVVGAAIGTLGFLRLLRANWILVATLVLPSVLAAAFIAVGGLTASPRFFLMALFPAILFAVAGAEYLIEKWPAAAKHPLLTSKITALVMFAAAATALIPLRHYYATPKQAYRASLQYIQTERKPGDIVVAIHLTEMGYRYYGPHFGLNDGNSYYVRSEDKLNQIIAAHPGDQIFVVTTLHRILRLTYPGLAARIEHDWQVVRMFPATIGDGELAVRRLR